MESEIPMMNRIMKKSTVQLYDTTLRDGAQAEDVNFSVEDMVRIAQKLDQFGVQYIEGGWPGSNPRDVDFFQEMRRVQLKKAKLVAFGATRRAKLTAAEDPSLKALVASGVSVATIFGKILGPPRAQGAQGLAGGKPAT